MTDMAKKTTVTGVVPGEVIIEFDTEQNQRVAFHPLQQTFRGRWDNHRLSAGALGEPGLYQLPVVPGLWVIIEPRNFLGKIVDPLGDAEHAKTLAACQKSWRSLFGNACCPQETIERKLTINDICTWFYWCQRLVESACARIIRGKLPTADELILAYPDGMVRKNFDKTESIKDAYTPIQQAFHDGETPKG